MKHLIVIGGGAAGFFTAINCAEAFPNIRVTILEKGKEVLQKVKVSGGGRCNVTHACFVPRELTKNYPRGQRELMGPFSKFQPGDTIGWFADRGVELKTEEDGRMFPITDSSQTIIDCFTKATNQANIKIQTRSRVSNLIPLEDGRWKVEIGKKDYLEGDAIMIAAGSSNAVWKMLGRLGHTIVEPVPSLFTFNIKDSRLAGMAGVSVPKARIKVIGTKLEEEGPLLITHWGMSGPGILKLSAWGARPLNEKKYQFQILVDWLTTETFDSVKVYFTDFKQKHPKKKIATNPQFRLPNRLWKKLVEAAHIEDTRIWGDISKKQLNRLCNEITQGNYEVNGKSTFKEEFVTCGGVKLKEIDFKTMQSKLLPNLYMAGEIINIDAITGGFNFQAAWTEGWIAGHAIGERLTSGVT